MESDYAKLGEAVRALALACDGAQSDDKVGFTRADSRLGTQVATIPDGYWSPSMAYSVWLMLAKYSKQLKKHGIIYDEIPTPKRAVSDPVDEIKTFIDARPRKSVSKINDKYVIRSEYDEQITGEIKQIPGIVWNIPASVWLAPESAKLEVAQLANKYGFDISQDIQSELPENTMLELEKSVTLNKRGLAVIKFPYSEQAIVDVKKIPNRIWDVKKKYWTAPLSFQVLEFADKFKLEIADDIRQSILDLTKKSAELLVQSTSTDAEIDVPRLNGKLMPYQRAGVAYVAKVGRCLIADQMGLGKLQAVSSPVLTPKGWMRMGDIKPGMFVTGKNGLPTLVTAVYPQGIKSLYRVTFSDGSSTLAGDEHLWTVKTANIKYSAGDWVTVTTGQIMRSETIVRQNLNGRTYELSLKIKSPNGNRRLQIPMVDPVQYENQNEELPIDPYILGCWLGDGTSSAGQITSMDDEIHSSFKNLYEVGKAEKTSLATTTTYFGLATKLRQIGVLNNKHIPEIYLRANKDARLALIQGLMDTDGYAGDCSTEFSTSKKELCDGMVELVQSLGGVVKIRKRTPCFKYKGVRRHGKLNYRLNIKLPAPIVPFRLQRKIDLYKVPSKYQPIRYIESIEYSHDEEAQCIAVDANDRLYVTENFIVTHNTVEAIASLEYRDAFPAIVVCPASLKENWSREIKKWLPHRTVNIVSGKTDITTADVNIVNYDIVGRFVEPILHLSPMGLVLDESHYIKTSKTKRTEAVRDIAKKIPQSGTVMLLSGTPVTNRPEELVSQLEVMGMIGRFGGKWAFLKRYTDAKHNGFGWDTKGASNLQELNLKLRQNCYIRRTKDEVLTELPAKTRNVVHIEPSGAGWKEYKKAENDLLAFLAENGYKSSDSAEHLRRTTILKRLAADAKMESVLEWIDSFLESCDRKLIVFAHNVAVVDQLAAKYGNLRVSGQDSMEDRQRAVDAFQNDKKARVIVLNLQAGGVGLTLTAGSDVCFVQQGWTPGEHDQAEDRAHRIGQKNSVQAWYLLGVNTIDEDIYDLIESKRSIVDAVTEGDEAENASIIGDLMKRFYAKTKP